MRRAHAHAARATGFDARALTPSFSHSSRLPMPVTVTRPVQVPGPGGKTIHEHVGRVASGTAGLSVAHLGAPPGWSEPAQTPAFDEVTVVLRGTMRVEHVGPDGPAVTDCGPGETVLVTAGERIRYLNPSATEPSEYWAVCTPAFSPETVHREPEA